MLYHDLYILVDLFGFQRLTKITVEVASSGELKCSFLYGDTLVNIDYNREGSVKRKSVLTLNRNVIFEGTQEDPLDFLVRELRDKDSFSINNIMLNLIAMHHFSSLRRILCN